MAADVADYLGLERVLWMPAGQPPHKASDAISAAATRLEMVRSAVVADPRFEVSSLELERPGASYTVDTVRELRSTFPLAELFLIVGVDQFRDFSSWRRPEEIARHASLAVMDRGGESAPALAGTVPGGRTALFVPVRRIDVSSTAIRDAVRQGRDIRAWVPERVEEVIRREGLYETR